MSLASVFLPEEISQYIEKSSVREPGGLAELRSETSSLPESNMQTSPEQAQFLALLVELLGVSRALEVGTFTGYTTLALALAMGEGGSIITCDIGDEWPSIGKKYWARAGVSDNIDLRVAPAAETLESLLINGLAGTFDLAYIDADKENYLAYYELCLQLVKRNGLVMADNTLWDGKVADLSVVDEETAALREFNRFVCDDERVSISLLPLGDGLTLLRKR